MNCCITIMTDYLLWYISLFLPGDHVTHLENVSEEEMNRLLGIVLDVEYLYTCVHKEEDADTKQVYFSLFKVSLRFYSQNIQSPNFLNCIVCKQTYILCFCLSFSCLGSPSYRWVNQC